jgi:hypothetical protein
MKPGQHFRVNAPAVVAQTFDDEVVVLNLDKGHYYSLTKAGAAIWNLIIDGVGTREIPQVLSQRFDATPAQIEAGMGQLLAELTEEQLLLPVAPPDAGGTPPPAAAGGPNHTRLPFEGLGVQKFTDMEEMLLLDPIHDVDETGWPNVKRA